MLTCVSFNTVQHSKGTQNMHNMNSVHLHCNYSFIFVHCETNESYYDSMCHEHWIFNWGLSQCCILWSFHVWINLRATAGLVRLGPFRRD